MTHVRRSTPTAGLEVILGVMPLDLHTQCVAAGAAYRIRGWNRDRWDGIGHSRLRGHLFWSNQLLKRVDMGDCVNSNKRAIQDLFHERWREHWKHLTTCRQAKYWIDDPGGIGDAMARLDRLTLSTVLQALTGHNYLNYHHHIAGNFSERKCRFCGEGCEEFMHLVCEDPRELPHLKNITLLCKTHLCAVDSEGCTPPLKNGPGGGGAMLMSDSVSTVLKWLFRGSQSEKFPKIPPYPLLSCSSTRSRASASVVLSRYQEQGDHGDLRSTPGHENVNIFLASLRLLHLRSSIWFADNANWRQWEIAELREKNMVCDLGQVTRQWIISHTISGLSGAQWTAWTTLCTSCVPRIERLHQVSRRWSSSSCPDSSSYRDHWSWERGKSAPKHPQSSCAPHVKQMEVQSRWEGHRPRATRSGQQWACQSSEITMFTSSEMSVPIVSWKLWYLGRCSWRTPAKPLRVLTIGAVFCPE